jgi:hypothetical protein
MTICPAGKPQVREADSWREGHVHRVKRHCLIGHSDHDDSPTLAPQRSIGGRGQRRAA